MAASFWPAASNASAWSVARRVRKTRLSAGTSIAASTSIAPWTLRWSMSNDSAASSRTSVSAGKRLAASETSSAACSGLPAFRSWSDYDRGPQAATVRRPSDAQPDSDAARVG